MTDDEIREARQRLHDLELEQGVYTLDGWTLLRDWLEEQLNPVLHRLTTDRITSTTFEEVAEQKGQIRAYRAVLERPTKVDEEIRRLNEQLRAAQETE